MKKKLIEAIKAKFVGIDEGTAKRLAERAIAKSEAITNDDEVAVAVDAITLADVLKSATDFSADDAVKKYEEKYNLAKGEKIQKPEEKKEPEEKQPETKPESDALAQMKALFKELSDGMEAKFKSVSTELAALKLGKISETRRSALDNAIKDLKEWQKKPYSRYQVDKMTDEEFDTLMSEVKEEVNDILAENKASGSRISPALGGIHSDKGGSETVQEASKEEIDALIDKFPSLN